MFKPRWALKSYDAIMGVRDYNASMPIVLPEDPDHLPVTIRNIKLNLNHKLLKHF